MIMSERYLPRYGLTRWLRHGTNIKATMMLQIPGPYYIATYGIILFHMTILERLESYWQPIVWETAVILNILTLSKSTLFAV